MSEQEKALIRERVVLALAKDNMMPFKTFMGRVDEVVQYIVKGKLPE